MSRPTGAIVALLSATLMLTSAWLGPAAVAAGSQPPPCTGLACGSDDDGYSAHSQAITITGGTRSGDDGGGTVTVVRSEPVYNPCSWFPARSAEYLLEAYNDPSRHGMFEDSDGNSTFPSDLAQHQGQAGTYYASVCRSGTWPGETFDEFTAFAEQWFDQNDSYVWVCDGCAPPPPPPLPPRVLMEYAREALQVPQPQVNRNPAANAVVNLPTWFWLNRATFDEISVTASTPPNWATVTVTPQTMSVSAPDATQQGSCASGGNAYNVSLSPAAQSTDCALQFARSSARHGGSHTVTVSTGWSASWVGSDGDGGALDGTTESTTVPVPVTEVQTVVTR